MVLSLEEFDIIIIGAGISGINCAYRVLTEIPDASFIILECRNGIGGTWAQFTYPGVRSDSDMYTLGFAWHWWHSPYPVGEGPRILEYLTAAASKHHILERIRFRHKVTSADWSSDQKWTLTVDHLGELKTFRASWIVLGTGYYDYQVPLQANIPGLDSYKGKLINPQFWPNDYDYENKKIALIGSGATAVTLMPHLAKKAAQLTMIQRSPTYIKTQSNTSWAFNFLPLSLVMACRRFYWAMKFYLIVVFCQYFPGAARKVLHREAVKQLPEGINQEDFMPEYNPWEQRICLDPDGIFYKALRRSNVEIITGKIKSVTTTEVAMQNGKTVVADCIITATGLNLKMGGGIDIRVDGNTMLWSKRFVWNGCMLDGVPNMMFMLGYTNNSWTLKADNTAMMLRRLWRHMARNGFKAAIPRAPTSTGAKTERLWQLSATYVALAEDRLPVYGTTGNWKPQNRPPIDYIHARWGNYTEGLEFSA
ncbi:FAD/NAD(P)-binding domain-containing protein [Biscogniauxia sp. FL1348]|nr:FAD/NAD(P)-binding domain-containing protein [Biscogniauxia sp. FL1348]